MKYLVGDKKLHDDSDYEDPCASLNIPANNDYSQRANNNMDNENDQNNSQDDEFNQQDGARKFIVEIIDKAKIEQIQEESSPTFGGGLPPYQSYAPSSGKIRKIEDIPNYKKLLLANVPIQNKALQT